ncbi:MAG: SOS response-associated peptidase [Cyanobacteria bacterium REEB67]|nr:SOS response-associated peptidase [Cyanobacteria bacterium REEB67]
MCGRYTLSYTMEEILEYFKIRQLLIPLEPRYNIAPSQLVPIVFTAQEGDEFARPGKRTIHVARWGFVPDWVKDIKKYPPMINARAETIAEKNSYRHAFRRRRCVIPADGFYEWLGSGKERLPFRIGLKGGGLFGFAGLYEDWTSPDGSMMRTSAIITVGANRLMEPFHDRMPAILSPDAVDIWLNNQETDLVKLQNVLRSYPDKLMECYRVSKRVNGTSFNDPALSLPIAAGEPEWEPPPKEKPKAPKAENILRPVNKSRSATDARQLNLFQINAMDDED